MTDTASPVSRVVRGTGPRATARLLWETNRVCIPVLIGQSMIWIGGRIGTLGAKLIDRIQGQPTW